MKEILQKPIDFHFSGVIIQLRSSKSRENEGENAYAVSYRVGFYRFLPSVCGYGHGVLVGFLQDQCVGTLICGRIGKNAKAALTIAGISVCANVCGSADGAVEDLLSECLTAYK